MSFPEVSSQPSSVLKVSSLSLFSSSPFWELVCPLFWRTSLRWLCSSKISWENKSQFWVWPTDQLSNSTAGSATVAVKISLNPWWRTDGRCRESVSRGTSLRSGLAGHWLELLTILFRISWGSTMLRLSLPWRPTSWAASRRRRALTQVRCQGWHENTMTMIMTMTEWDIQW